MSVIDILRGVNEQNPLDPLWIPENLIWDPIACVWIVRSVYEVFYQMNRDIQKEGLPALSIALGYRSYAMQKKLYNEELFLTKRALNKSVENYAMWCDRKCKPGTSEHQLGTAIDLVSPKVLATKAPEEGFVLEREMRCWLAEYASDYGLIQTEEKNKPWHYRYIGRGHAKKIQRLAITPDAYFESIQSRET